LSWKASINVSVSNGLSDIFNIRNSASCSRQEGAGCGTFPFRAGRALTPP
jgi:hypothetical protein